MGVMCVVVCLTIRAPVRSTSTGIVVPALNDSPFVGFRIVIFAGLLGRLLIAQLPVPLLGHSPVRKRQSVSRS